jgi:hypothetical protein
MTIMICCAQTAASQLPCPPNHEGQASLDDEMAHIGHAVRGFRLLSGCGTKLVP